MSEILQSLFEVGGPVVYAVGLAFFLLGLWSLRHLAVDVLAGGVIRREGRIRPGMRIRVGEIGGRVERMGMRAIWLSDDSDRKVALPNHLVVERPVYIDSGRYVAWSVSVRLPQAPPDLARRALSDAVLTSPWVAVFGKSSVLRDPEVEGRWHIHVELLDPRFGPRFEGELLERAEEMLASEAGFPHSV